MISPEIARISHPQGETSMFRSWNTNGVTVGAGAGVAVAAGPGCASGVAVAVGSSAGVGVAVGMTAGSFRSGSAGVCVGSIVVGRVVTPTRLNSENPAASPVNVAEHW